MWSGRPAIHSVARRDGDAALRCLLDNLSRWNVARLGQFNRRLVGG